MATRKAPPSTPRPANLSVQQMREALPRLQRRLDELEAFDAKAAGDEVSNAARALQQKYEDTLVEVFGNDTVEYGRYHISSFYQSSTMVVMAGPFGRGPQGPNFEAYQNGVARGITFLRTIIELFEEKVGDAEGPMASPSRSLEALDLHPQIADATANLFRSGHYANAVEDACKALDILVKLKSMRVEPSGTELMQLVFSPKNPILKFNEQTNESERSEQQGMMYLYSGAMLAFRNPRAHGLLSDDPIVALEIIGFVNFLAKALSKTSRS